MRHSLPAEPDRPAEGRIWNQTEMAEINLGKEIRVSPDECLQYGLWHNFGAHGAMEKKIEVFAGPFIDLAEVEVDRTQINQIGGFLGGQEAKRERYGEEGDYHPSN